MGLVVTNGGQPQVLGGSIASDTLTPPMLSASVNNYAPSGLENATTLKLRAASAVSITGLLAGNDCEVKFLLNGYNFDITLTNADVLSAAANRFNFGADLILAANGGMALIMYSTTIGSWQLIASGSASGGGGGTPAAPDTAVQFNDGGAFGGDADFTYDPITQLLSVLNLLASFVNVETIAINSGFASSYTAATPLSGDTIVMSESSPGLMLTPAGTLATLTITLPIGPNADGTEVFITTTEELTALTVDSTGNTVVGEPTTLLAGGFFRMKWRNDLTTWNRCG